MRLLKRLFPSHHKNQLFDTAFNNGPTYYILHFLRMEACTEDSRIQMWRGADASYRSCQTANQGGLISPLPTNTITTHLPPQTDKLQQKKKGNSKKPEISFEILENEIYINLLNKSLSTSFSPLTTSLAISILLRLFSFAGKFRVSKFSSE